MDTLQIVTAKELAFSMGISLATANRYLKDIKQEYQCRKVLGEHVNKYFKINAKNS
ncbi:MAG: hypothetical protein ABIP27_19175 [Flavobacterium circumlabens]|uniref:hypothetical protein n=1 Tax=Flavobacterium circumlabens TaxID=2133765 RepID=UPI003266F15F